MDGSRGHYLNVLGSLYRILVGILTLSGSKVLLADINGLVATLFIK